MESPESRFSELVEFLRSWLPQRPRPATVSRAFWMPDQSCRVCYECDSQFTVFNRRHHCRLCGRVFCGGCTANSVPIPSNEPENSHRIEVERIRVCNYCFKQWEENLTVPINGNQASSPGLSPSPSSASLASIKSGGTARSSNTTGNSMAYPNGACQKTEFNSCQIYPDGEDVVTEERSSDSVAPTQDPPLNSFGFCINRSDDDEDDVDSRQCLHSSDFYAPSVSDEENSHPSRENNDQKCLSSTDSRGTEFESSSSLNKMIDETGSEGMMCDGEPSSSIYNIERTDSQLVDTEPVDFENNGLLWLPPDPEDEDDDRDTGFLDDDDDDGDDDESSVSGWGNLQSTNSFGSGEFRLRYRPTDDHRKAMKHVVNGHFRALISQLLQVENLSLGEENDADSWLDIITSLSWEAATLLKPDTSRGDGMDPGGYLKIKCIASGHRSESMVIKGIVCKKNVAHRRMTSRIKKPRFLILGGALEYQRKANSLSSVDTLLQQETDHLKMAVAKIDAQHPNVLLVEKSVSRFAQECLLVKGISLVLNMKRPLLDRIARCTGAQVAPSVDNLSTQMLGHCDLFHVEKLLEEHGSAGQGGKKLVKTLMFFDGCPRPLGCTVLLKGASGDELKKVKHVIQYGVFAAYHLALETSFLADEGASLSDLPLNSSAPPAPLDSPSRLYRSISVVPGFTIPTGGIRKSNFSVQMVNKGPDQSEDSVSSIHSSQPSFRASEELSSFLSTQFHNSRSFSYDKYSPRALSNARYSITAMDRFEDGDLKADSRRGNSEGQHFDISRSQSLPVEDHSGALAEDFPPSPSDHQSILVSLSTRCVWKGTVCERAHLFRIKYYGSFDRPLGRFLRDHLFDQGYRCRSCDMPSEAHIHCYTHRQGSLIISVKKLPDFPLPGERDGKIWMWHRCMQCPRVNKIPPATRRVVMSDAAWGLSFGKFLELSFSNHVATSRVASCGHSLHRDCLRFYGFGKMVACFRYASIDVHSVYLPPSKLDFNQQHQDWVQKEADEVAAEGERLFSEVEDSLQRRAGISDDLQAILQAEKAQFEESLKRIMMPHGPYPGQPIDILEVNKLQRQLLLQAHAWDQRLTLREKDIPLDTALAEPKEAEATLSESLEARWTGPALTLGRSSPSSLSLLLPAGVNDTIVPVLDDEPTSVIAHALASAEYHEPLAQSHLAQPEEVGPGVNDSVRVTVAGKYTVTCYYAKSFEALRRGCCPSERDFIRSLSRCKKWGAQGGKSNVFFAKTLDERFVIKQVTKTELESFMQFGAEYFAYLAESMGTGSPTCLAKIVGMFQVAGAKGAGRMDVLVMENLLYGRNVVRIYDLKGSARSRYNADCSGRNTVLLDQNFIEAMPTSPIFVGNKAKRLLERAVWNDTAFLASVDVMDYSLLVGVDEERGELVLGIIDFMRQYTWDKHLETWVKASGILGGPKNAPPTVISPKQYKKRFRKAMSAYFLMVPDQWSLPIIVPSRSLSDLAHLSSSLPQPPHHHL
ncbi:1-phosphatidylinositol-3-phosphate 5-kinase FAB1A isoform X2 [Wolffia australiana]